ncbi:phage tail tape measure protein, partial [Raoultella ornithinolytica]
NLKQQSELAAGSTQELSREQAVLQAQQSLGKGATQEQIALAGKYRGEIWDTANALKAQAAAEKLLPEARENASYQQDVKDLQTALAAKKITQQQYNQTSEQLEAQHQVNLAKIRAQQTVSPMQEARGQIDPVQQLANQHAQELALIQQFETQKGQITQRGLELMNAANTQYEQQRIAAQWALFTQQSVGYEALGAAVDAFGNQASNALTGVITGSMSANDALSSIGSTILNDVINTFVQMGLQQAKSAIMGASVQQATIAATTATQVGALATTTAASTASAGTTMAAWLPAALVASVGSFGAAAIIGGAALVGAFALSKTLAGGRKNGGPVSAGSMYQVGEGGMPEIYKASNGSQYMIPGDNGSVISNKDLRGSGAGGSLHVTNNVYNYASGVQVDTRSTQNGSELLIETFVTDLQSGGPMSGQIESTYGLRRQANGDY